MCTAAVRILTEADRPLKCERQRPLAFTGPAELSDEEFAETQRIAVIKQAQAAAKFERLAPLAEAFMARKSVKGPKGRA